MRRFPWEPVVLAAGLLMACSVGAVVNQEAYTRVVIDNQEWRDATVQFYCGSERAARSRVDAARRTERHYALTPCHGGLAVTVRFFPQRPREMDRVSNREYGLRADSWVRITIPNRQETVYLAFFPER